MTFDPRGFFEIGIMNAKTETNVGTLWRSAHQLGAAGVFMIGRRYVKQSSDTLITPRHIPLRHFASLHDFNEARPHGALLIGIEQGGTPLHRARHPQQAIYLLGAEDSGLSKDALALCDMVVSIDSSDRPTLFNVAVAGSIVMYERFRQLRRDEAKA